MHDRASDGTVKRGRVKVRVRRPVFLEADYTVPRSPIKQGHEPIFVTLVSVECVMTVTEPAAP